jgi:precorrin-6B methylase 2
VTSAARRWRTQLLARSIPPEVLAAAPESPYGFPSELFRRRAERSTAVAEPTPTTVRALEALPPGGTVLDVGCGAGATSLPLVKRAGRMVGVDGQDDMLEAFQRSVAAAGIQVGTLPGRWPDVAAGAPIVDTVVCGHVLYNAPDIEPFVGALDAHSSHRVVIELTETHPLSWMGDLWHRFHDLRCPVGPTVDDAEDVIRGLGFGVVREDRVSSGDAGGGGFTRREDAIALVRRRLCLPPDRDAEIVDALGPRLRERDGVWSAGPHDQTIVTLWWDVPPAR